MLSPGSNSETSRARLRRTIWRDALIIFGGFAALLAYFISIEAFEYVVRFADTHESWEFDEILTTIMVLPIAMVIFSIRRLREAHRELQRRIEAEEQAQVMAMHDPLTGLPNRRNITHAIESALRLADRKPFALLLLDLNRFKAINDLQGHQVGDQVLIEAAARLRAHAGTNAVASRLGGDEFVILLMNAPAGATLVTRIEEISGSFDRPFDLENGTVSVGASIGATYINSSQISSDAALSQADAAMYKCKVDRKNSFHFFETGMEMVAIRRAELEADLREAIRAQRIEPHYQPLVCLKDGRVIGYEVLARWRREDGRLRLPEEFIGLAEEIGLIGDIYYRLLARAAADAQHWSPELSFSVNLSPVQFGDYGLVERTLRILTEAGVDPGRLEIEITENALVSDIELARNVIRRFKSRGIKVALDDFGTGYSSLRHLSELDFDKPKIDGAFVHDVDSNRASQTIVRAITSLAHNLGLQVTAEGIETEEDARTVMSFGCDVGQGYLYGRPASKAGFGEENRDQPRAGRRCTGLGHAFTRPGSSVLGATALATRIIVKLASELPSGLSGTWRSVVKAKHDANLGFDPTLLR